LTTMGGGGVQIASGNVGALLLPDGGSGLIDASARYQTINPIQYVNSKSRAVGWAFEVLNTTAELYKQGTVTAYRMPQIDIGMIANTSAVDSIGNFVFQGSKYRAYSLPPSTAAEALVLPASKQWPAERGYYGVCTLMNETNLMETCCNEGRMYLEREVIVDQTTVLSAIFTPAQSNAQTGSTLLYPAYHAPYNTNGAYFTGLSYQTTLTINMKLLLESAPGPRSPLATLAEPSPAYDPEALRVYSQLVTKLPVGVPFDENPDGEWFRTVLGTLGTISTMASAINPMFGVLGAGLGIAADVVPRFLSLVKSKEKVHPKPQMTNAPSTLKRYTPPSNQTRGQFVKAKSVMPTLKGNSKLATKLTRRRG